MQVSDLSTNSRTESRRSGIRTSARSGSAFTQWDVQTHDRIAPLEDHWRDLEAKGGCGLFQSFDWYGAWCDVASRHGFAEPVIVTAARQLAAKPEVILPLCRVRKRGYSEIGFPRVVTDFAGPVIAPEILEEEGVFGRLWPQILRALPKCDLVQLRVLPQQVGGFRNPLLDLNGAVPFSSGLWGIPLKAASPGELPSMIDRKLVRKTNRRERRLEESHERRFEWHEQSDALRQHFQSLVELRKARSRDLGRNEILQDPKWLDFYLTVITRSHRSVRPVITRLTADNTTIAVNLGFVYNGVFYDLLPGLAGGDWSRYAPGIQLILETIREAAGRGIGHYDMSIGDQEYKASLGAQRLPLFHIIFPRSIRGWLLYLLWRLKFMVTWRFGLQAEQGP